MKKRLLKDLPFLDKDKVVVKHQDFRVNGGQTFYDGGGSSSNATTGFSESETAILVLIWDNKEWFQDAELRHITVIPSTTNVIIKFDPIDIEDAESLASGIIHLLKTNLQDGSWVWSEFDIESSELRNR